MLVFPSILDGGEGSYFEGTSSSFAILVGLLSNLGPFLHSSFSPRVGEIEALEGDYLGSIHLQRCLVLVAGDFVLGLPRSPESSKAARLEPFDSLG